MKNRRGLMRCAVIAVLMVMPHEVSAEDGRLEASMLRVAEKMAGFHLNIQAAYEEEVALPMRVAQAKRQISVQPVATGMNDSAEGQSPVAGLSALYRRITQIAGDMKTEFESDPTVSVVGFSIEMGLPPAVSVDFEFNSE